MGFLYKFLTHCFCAKMALKRSAEKSRTSHRIDSEEEQPDGAIILRVRKEYNNSASVGDYFD